METTWERVYGWRLARQYLAAPAPDLAGAAARLGGVQAQVMSSAELALGLRVPGATAETVKRALWDERTLVKTWAMRGTLHLLPAREYALWVGALSTRSLRMTPGWERYHGVTRAEAEAITEAVPEALAGRCLTREELGARIGQVTGKPHLVERMQSGWGVLLKTAANSGQLCFGPDRGRNVTFVAPGEWLAGGVSPRDSEEALGVVLRRFLDAYGPATADDFARWWGTTAKIARQLFDRQRDALVAVRAPHRSTSRGSSLPGAWLTRDGAAGVADGPPAPPALLLGGFDPYVLAPLSHRPALIPDGFGDRVSRTAGWISPVLLVDGRVAGTWRPEHGRDATILHIEVFHAVTRAVRQAARSHADEHERVLGRPVELRWSGGV